MTEIKTESNALTVKQAAALEILKASGEQMLAREIAAANPEVFTKPSGVNAIMTHLVARGLVAKSTKKDVVVDKNGNSIEKDYVTYFNTPEGAELVYSIKA